VLAIAVAKLTFAKNDAPNRNALYDTGAATALLSWRPLHAGWPFIRWPDLIRKKRVRSLEFPWDGKPSPRSPSVTRAIQLPCLSI